MARRGLLGFGRRGGLSIIQRHGATANRLAVFLNEDAGRPYQFVYRLRHMDRYAYGPRLVGNGPGYSLSDPPGRVGAELVAPLVLKLVDRLHQSDIPFLYKIQEGQSPVRVLLGNADNKTQICPNQRPL